MPLRDILERGYFPKELPNPFVTSLFAASATSAVGLPKDFNPTLVGANPRVRSAKQVKYSHARGGLLRRPLSIPNPLTFYYLAREIDQHWSALQAHVGGTTLSATRPVFAPIGRAIQGAQSQSMGPTLAVQTRLNNRYVLKTDINRFYQSIYTHSIPWAVHTKPFAKANRGMAHIGNRLDFLTRNGQDGQTVGISIGPDTSLVLAEILMQRCDRELLNTIPGLRGHRFIDDYELGFKTRTDAENAFHLLEKILSEYELALNPRKTVVEELPCPMEALWVAPLRSFPLRTTAAGQASDLVSFFDAAFELNRRFPGEAVLQFAVSRLRSMTVIPQNWTLFQRLLLNVAVPEPAALPFVLEAIIDRVNAGASPARGEIEEALNTILVEHAELGHSSEVAWALWACLALGIGLTTASVMAVSCCDDSVVAVLSLHCQSRGLGAIPLNTSLWMGYMNSQALYEENWLLAYEANIKGWLPSPGRRDHVTADRNFGFLKANGVSFYDPARAVPIALTAPVPVPRPVIPPSRPGRYGYS